MGPKRAEKSFSSIGRKVIFETVAIHVLLDSGHIKIMPLCRMYVLALNYLMLYPVSDFSMLFYTFPSSQFENYRHSLRTCFLLSTIDLSLLGNFVQ